MLFLLIKLFTTPALIWASTLAARRWGPVIGGGPAGLPFISGPASLFIAVQYGTPFAASAAASSLLGAVASCCYCLAYAHSARRFGWAGSLALALLAFLLCAFLLTRVSCGLPVAVCLSIAVPAHVRRSGDVGKKPQAGRRDRDAEADRYGQSAGNPACLRLLPDIPGTADMRRVQPPWRLPVQMFCGGLSVLILTELAGVVGEQWSGILLTFPIISSILTPFAHLSFGARAAVLTIRGLLAGFFGTSCFITIIAVCLEPLGIASGYCIAALGALLTSILIMHCVNKRR